MDSAALCLSCSIPFRPARRDGRTSQCVQILGHCFAAHRQPRTVQHAPPHHKRRNPHAHRHHPPQSAKHTSPHHAHGWIPGEDEKAFDELKRFVAEARFERMGAFAYCEEDGTYAAKHYADDIPQEVKNRRLAEIMELQEAISLETNRSKIGTTLKVIVDREEPDYFVGRTEFDSPEVDPEVLIKKNEQLRIGEFCQAKITDALPFELMAEAANA